MKINENALAQSQSCLTKALNLQQQHDQNNFCKADALSSNNEKNFNDHFLDIDFTNNAQPASSLGGGSALNHSASQKATNLNHKHERLHASSVESTEQL